MAFIHRRININATSWRCQKVGARWEHTRVQKIWRCSRKCHSPPKAPDKRWTIWHNNTKQYFINNRINKKWESTTEIPLWNSQQQNHCGWVGYKPGYWWISNPCSKSWYSSIYIYNCLVIFSLNYQWINTEKKQFQLQRIIAAYFKHLKQGHPLISIWLFICQK